MMRHKFTIGSVALAFALGALPAMAQENPPQSRPAGGAERTGSASPRGGAGAEARGGGESRGAGESRGTGSSGGGMSGGGSMGTSSSPSAPSSSGKSDGGAISRAPRRDDSSAQSTGRRAVPRGGSTSGATTTRGSGSSRDSGASPATVGGSPERTAVPVNNRPRDGRPVTGQAIERRNVPPGTGGDIYYIYRPYYNPYGFWGPGLGYGLGYLYYDPFYFGGYGYDPYGYGGGYYGGGTYYGGGGYSGSGGYSQSYRDAGSLRLKIKPREAQVFVDGYFVGVVDSFDGTFQKLTLDGGGHRVEIKAVGFEPVQFDVLITPGETTIYRGDLKRIQ